jgi:DNA repair protein RecN (Recombination protein N)
MLACLSIQDVVLIEKLSINFAQGLNVFTGETGAGKSILLDSLGLALGGRSDAGLVRSGADQAVVTAEFSFPLPKTVSDILADRGLAVDEPLILRRLLSKDGKSRAYLNDQAISVGLLKEIGENLLEIHGQFDTHGLLNPSTHKDFLDSFAGHSALREKTAQAYRAWQDSERKLGDAAEIQKNAANEEGFLRASVGELDEISPEAGEADKLAERRKQIQHFEKIADGMNAAFEALSGEKGAGASLVQAGKVLARIADLAEGVPEILGVVDRLASEVEEVAENLHAKLAAIQSGPTSLQQIEDRLFGLRALARKHNVSPDELPALRDRLAERLSLLTDQGDVLNKLGKEAREKRKSYEDSAKLLSEKRTSAAKSLALKVMKELPPLKLEKARFLVEVSPLPQESWSADGIDRVAFLASANAGLSPGPLQKVASGGELSRFMLALKLVLTSADPVPVLVFDEVDAGIGGATASAVGERLAALAKKIQILVVTHSPQVAALGQRHLRVEKTVKGKKTTTDTLTLDDGERVEEIARMLSGSKVTDAARAAAKSLLKDA